MQSLTYAYTLQGWLKGVNPVFGGFSGVNNASNCAPGSAVTDLVVNNRSYNTPFTYTAQQTITFDNGFESTSLIDSFETKIDATLALCRVSSDSLQAAFNNPANPVYGFSLHYFNGDYQPIGINTPTGLLPALGSEAAPLYNGNIAAMAVNIPMLGNTKVYNYHYDQLNRLVAMDAFNGLNPTAGTFIPIKLDDYKERISYDANGNILTFQRNGTGSSVNLNNYSYAYQTNTNRLSSINNSINSTTNSYDYDAIGNVIKDDKQGVASNTWNVYGKLESVQKTDGTSIVYSYDASGNRISKTVSPSAGTAYSECYIHDAQGNILSIYRKDGSGSLSQSEINLYGSSRLGMVKNPVTQTGYQNPKYLDKLGNGYLSIFSRGKKQYDLTEHRGNVMVSLSDKKILQSDGTYNAVVASANDYSSFGVILNNRNYNSSNNRFTYNGKELDRETGYQNYGMRISDPDAGRFISVDPLTKKFAMLTPYQFASNRPIDGIDMDGKEYMQYYVFLKNDGSFLQKVMVQDFRNKSEEEMNRIHGTTDFYKQYSAGFGPQGREISYTYFRQSVDGSFEMTNNSMAEVSQELGLMSRISRHGVYYGAGSVTTKGPLFKDRAGVGDYDLSVKPIDMVDAIAKEHDKEEDKKGFISWTHPQNTSADIRFVKRLEKYYESALYDENYIDPFTGRKPSQEAIEAAGNAISLFSLQISSKKNKLEKMLKNKSVTQDQYNKWQKDIHNAENQRVELPTLNKTDK